VGNSDQLFDSSDSTRNAAPLRHAHHVHFGEPLRLELGGELPEVTVAYETYGQLDKQRTNAVLVCHAISGDSHVARHAAGDQPGWWDLLVGPGRSIDTDRYFVICPNILGGCRGSTGPNSIDPRTGKRYGAAFPAITVGDMVEVQRRLIDHLGIPGLRAVVGGSLGGQQALTWAVRFPDRLRGCVALATSHRLTSQALAFDVVGRNAIMHDPGYHGGEYYDQGPGPAVGLALARMLAHITYLSREAMTAKFDPSRLKPQDIATEFEKKFSVGSYLAYQGHKFVERFDANSYVTLSLAMDLFDLGDSAEVLRAALAHSRCRWLVLSFTSDWLFPPEQSRAIVGALIAANKPVTFCNVATAGGHDSFLLEEKLAVYGRLVQAFLANLDGRASAALQPGDGPTYVHEPTNLFHGHRLDYDIMLDLIPADASVLDLGCGSGVLLSQLRERGHTRLVGVELDEQAIVACVERGLDVVHRDLNEGLSSFIDGQFDVVVLSQTLQSIADTERIVDEMLRVGRRAIVGFPNFAYHKLRRMLVEEGRSPKAFGAYGYEWYNTPNRRFPSIADFEDFCRAKSIRIHREIYLDSESDRQITEDPNRNADMAIFVLSHT
jgi:homoserine O-acetyltransferase